MDAFNNFPPCFARRKYYELWLDAAHETNQVLKSEYCTDCMPSFKARMCKMGLCEHTETVFDFQVREGFDSSDEPAVVIVGRWQIYGVPSLDDDSPPVRRSLPKDSYGVSSPKLIRKKNKKPSAVRIISAEEYENLLQTSSVE